MYHGDCTCIPSSEQASTRKFSNDWRAVTYWPYITRRWDQGEGDCGEYQQMSINKWYFLSPYKVTLNQCLINTAFAHRGWLYH